MTEDQARTKWCPMVRAGNAPGCNRSDATTTCKASDCMMWVATDREAVPCMPDGEPDFKEAGHCGLCK